MFFASVFSIGIFSLAVVESVVTGVDSTATVVDDSDAAGTVTEAGISASTNRILLLLCSFLAVQF